MAPAAAQKARVAYQAELSLQPLKNCLVNLPAPLATMLVNSNMIAQDIIAEIQYTPKLSSGANKKDQLALKSVYVGWTGMQSTPRAKAVVGAGRTPTKEREIMTVELDSTFASTLGLTDRMSVGIFLHPRPPQAHTIHIEPLTATDWEIIELHANFLELNLISQIRAIPNPASQNGSNHPLTVHLSPTSTANITITSLEPVPAALAAFVKIAPNAEVIVAPKERNKSGLQPGRDVQSKRSIDGRSAASTTRSRSRHAGSVERPPLLLRGVARDCATDWFDDTEEEDWDEGLRIWVDPDLLQKKELRDATFVSVSIVRPTGYQGSDLKRQEGAESTADVKAATKVIAKVMPWLEAPDLSHVALSSALCSVLDTVNMVGEVIRIQAASPKLSNTAVRGLQVFPFMDSSSETAGIKFGGKSRADREAATKNIISMYGKNGEEAGLLLGPLTDGMTLPPRSSSQHGYFPGGIVKFEYASDVSPDNKKNARGWIMGSDRPMLAIAKEETNNETAGRNDSKISGRLTLEVGMEIIRPTASRSLWTIGEPLPAEAPALVGIDSLISDLMTHLRHGSSTMLTGGRQSGRTSLTQLLALRLRHEHSYHTTHFSCKSLSSEEKPISAVKEMLRRLFGLAKWGTCFYGRALVVLEDLDSLCPVETELQTGDNGRSRHISELLVSMVRQHCSHGSRLVILATAKTKEDVNNVIIGGHVVQEIINLPAPDKETRRRILEAIATEGHSPPNDAVNLEQQSTSGFVLDPSLDFLDLAGKTDGYMPGDLRLLISRARSECLIRSLCTSPTTSFDSTSAPHLILNPADFTSALQNFTPSTLRSIPLATSTISMSSIGGLKATRATLLETLQYPTLYAPIFAASPLRLRSGLLLYGPPGCGKTLLASAIASTAGLNFISVKGPEILNKYIGASEAAVRNLFQRAQAARPCILFFDEFDSVAPKRGHDSTGVTDRVVNQLLTQMDGAEGLQGVYVLAATSRPDLIDPALLRPGRLDRSLICDMPDEEDREDILRKLVGAGKVRMGEEVLSQNAESEGTLKEVARRTEGYSGADLQAVIYNAQLEAIHDVLGDRDDGSDGKAESHANASKTNGETTEEDMDFTYFRIGDRTRSKHGEGDGEAEPVIPQTAAERATERLHIAEMLRTHRTALEQQQTRLQRRPNSNNINSSTSDSNHPNGDAQEKMKSAEPTIHWTHLLRSLAQTKASISMEERRRLNRIYREFVVGRNGEMPQGGEDAGKEVGGRSSLM